MSSLPKDDQKRAFLYLKPFCVAVLTFPEWVDQREPSRALVDLLEAERHIQRGKDGDDALGSVAEFVLFPLLQLLQHSTTSDANAQVALQCLDCALSALAASLDAITLPQDAVLETMTILGVFVAVGGFGRLRNRTAMSTPPEQLQMAAISALSALIRACRKGPLDDDATTFAHVPDDAVWKPLSHCILGLLETAESRSRDFACRTAALNVLNEIVEQVSGSAVLLSHILPGIVSTASKLCLGDAKEHHKIVVLAATVIGRCMSAALNAARLRRQSGENEGGLGEMGLDAWANTIEKWKSRSDTNVSLPEKDTGKTDSQNEAARSAGWPDSVTLEHLRKLLPTLLTRLRSHLHAHVKEAAVELAGAVFASSLESFTEMAVDAAETLLISWESELAEASRLVARRHLLFVQKADSEARTDFEGQLCVLFSKALANLPRTIQKAVFAGQEIDEVRLLAGFLDFPPQSWSPPTTPERAEDMWISDVEEALTDFLSEEPRPAAAKSTSGTLAALLGGSLLNQVGRTLDVNTRSSANGSDKAAFRLAVGRFFKLWGQLDTGFGDAFSDRLAEACRSSSLTPGLVFIFDAGAAPVLSMKTPTLLRNILVDALQTETGALGDRRLVPRTREGLGQGKDLMLRLDVIRICCHQLDRTLLETLLPDLMFFCLSNIGIGAVSEHASGLDVLQILADKFQLSSVADLVVDNIDSVIDMFCSRLRRLYLMPAVPLALRSAIVLAGPRVAPFIEDTVDEVIDALDVWRRNDEIVASLLGILADIAGAVALAAKDLVSNEKSKQPTQSQVDRSMLPADLDSLVSREMEAFWLKWGPLTRNSEDDKEEIDGILGAEPPDSDRQHTLDDLEDKEPTLDPSAKLLVQILDKCAHFLSHPAAEVRRGLLRVFRSALPGLGPFQKELLPLVHRIWPGIVFRLGDGDRFVSLEAMSVVSVLADLCTDFLSKRISDDIMPKLSGVWKSVFATLEEVTMEQRALVTTRAAFNSTLLHQLLAAATTLVRRVPLRLKDLHALEGDVYPLLDIMATSAEFSGEGAAFFSALAEHDWEGTWLLVQAWFGHQEIPEWYAGVQRRSKVPEKVKKDVARRILGA